MFGFLTIDNDGFGYKIDFSIDVETNTIEVFVPGKGFRFNKQNADNLQEDLEDYLIENLEWSDSMIQTFQNMIYSDVWIVKGKLKYNGIIEDGEQLILA
jgi:hypothetical protein